MNCPGCKNPMVQEHYEGVLIDHCKKCGGNWLDRGEVEQVVNDHSTTFSDAEKIKALESKGTDHRKGQEVKCPKCHAQMGTHQYMFNSGVFIDSCPNRHGFYFDNGELEKAQIVMEEYLLQRGKHSSQTTDPDYTDKKICPRDAVPLHEVGYESEVVDRCSKCHGFWCDDDELGRITEARLKKFSDADHSDIKAQEGAAQVSAEFDLFVSLRCPVCRKPMQRLNYSYSSGIIIDRCVDGHGVWLDEDELERVQLFVERWEGEDANLRQRYGTMIKNAQNETDAHFRQMEKETQEWARNARRGPKQFGNFIRLITDKPLKRS